MKAPANYPGASLITTNPSEGGEKKSIINPELWQACAGPLVNLPAGGTHVVYFPQGHSEQVAASMKKGVDAQIPSYPNLQSKLLCILHNVTLHADPETDEVYAQMTLQPVPSFDKEALLRSDISMKSHKPQTEFFCKTLTASDTSTHGGFSVPRRAAEKIFPPLDFSMQPPAQELVARDLHDNLWTFRHIYRGQPKRHLLTTGWSLFISGKRLSAGDSVLFIRDERQQLLLGIRRANRQPANLSSSVLSSDSMHIGVLAAAAHAAANNSPFTVFYNPRASPSEFVIPLAKYYKAVCGNQLSLGMRFRMMFETEESGTRRYMGTITGINDLDGVRWKNSQWRNIQVGWDESTGGERRNRVSIWEIEPVTAPFFICPTTPFYGSKRPRQPGMLDDESADLDNMFKRTMPWLGEDTSIKDPGLSLVQWMNMQQNSTQPGYLNPLSGPVLQNSIQPGYLNTLSGSVLQNYGAPDLSRQLGIQFNSQSQRSTTTTQLTPPATMNPLASMMQPQPQNPRAAMNPLASMVQPQPQNLVQSQIQSQNGVVGQTQTQSQSLQKSMLPPQFPDQQQFSQQLQMPENQTQLLQKLYQQQQSLLAHQSSQKKPLEDVYQSFSKSISTGQTAVTSLPQQMPRNNIQLAVPTNQSGITDDVPSCSTSTLPSMINERSYLSSVIYEETTQNSAYLMNNNNGLKTGSENVKDLSQNQGFIAPQTYLHHVSGAQMDYLDSSSSGTSVCLSQSDLHLQHHSHSHSQTVPFRDTIQDGEVQDDIIPFGAVIPDPLITKGMMESGKNFHNNLMISRYENPTKENQPELSSSMASQSFGVPDMTFNSIDSTINDTTLMNSTVWAPPPQPFQRIRTYTKVYKRGAVGRSIDITGYSGYGELKQDLARRFGIVGQLEDHQRIGWKLVYVDHENDVLLVGDDPWEEFVSCVRCIKILSPQEVQQMSLDGDFGRNNVHPNQACSSSDV